MITVHMHAGSPAPSCAPSESAWTRLAELEGRVASLQHRMHPSASHSARATPVRASPHPHSRRASPALQKQQQQQQHGHHRTQAQSRSRSPPVRGGEQLRQPARAERRRAEAHSSSSSDGGVDEQHGAAVEGTGARRAQGMARDASLDRVAAKVAEMEAVESSIYARWFGGGAGCSDAACALIERRSASPAAASVAADAGNDAEARHIAADTTHAHGIPVAIPTAPQAVPTPSRPRRLASARTRSPSPPPVDLVEPHTVAAALRQRAAHLEAQREADAVLAAAGGASDAAAAAAFRPIAVVEAVTDAVIDDEIAEHVGEMLALCDEAVEGLYAAEFAPMHG